MFVRGEPYLWGDLYDTSVNMDVAESAPYNMDVLDSPDASLVIRSFHMNNGYNVPDDAHIILGMGSTQVLMGLIYAIGTSYYSQPMSYPDYKTMVVDLQGREWSIDPHVEFVTCPNNPDGRILSPTTDADIIIWDMVYSWPWYGVDHGQLVRRNLSMGRSPILVFSCSKSIGLGGARVGYAIIHNDVVLRYPDLIPRYQHYITVGSQGITTTGESMAMFIMSRRVRFPEIRSILLERWDQMKEALERRIPGIKILSPRGFYYIWAYSDGMDLYGYLRRIGIDSTPGTTYGVTTEYVRLNMCAGIGVFNDAMRSLYT